MTLLAVATAERASDERGKGHSRIGEAMGEDGDRDQIITAGQRHPGFISTRTSANTRPLGALAI